MDEIKIGEALEQEKEKEEIKLIERALREEEEEKGEGKSILISLGILIGVIAVIFGGFKLYDHFTGAGVISIDELHKENLAGELSAEEGYLYRGFSFVYVDGLWWTEVKRGRVLFKIPLHFGPREVEEVKVEGKLSPDFNEGEDVYVVIDPELENKYYSLALSELNFNMVKGLGRKPVAACSKENPICEEREILNCNKTEGKPVIELSYGGEPRITLEGTCILINGEEYGIVKAADRLILQWYGIMQ